MRGRHERRRALTCSAPDMTTTPAGGGWGSRDDRGDLRRHRRPCTPAAEAYWPHFSIAALSMLIPAGRCRGRNSVRVDERPVRDGIGEVRHAVATHAPGELEARRVLLGCRLGAREPGRLQTLADAEGLRERRAVRVHRRAVRDPSIVNSPDAFGSGNAPTPLARMHSAKFTAFSREWRVCCRRCCRCRQEWPRRWCRRCCGCRHSPRMRRRPTRSWQSAASGWSVLLIVAPWVRRASAPGLCRGCIRGICSGVGACRWWARAAAMAAMTPSRPATGSRKSGRSLFLLVFCGSCRQSGQRGVASTYAVFDTPTICAGS